LEYPALSRRVISIISNTVPVDFSGEVHDQCQDDEYADTSNQQREVFQLNDHENEDVKDAQ
jgi:hypothetical protein